MRIYINAILNHFRALQDWAADKPARLHLDLKSFEIEAKYRGRYYTLYPMFQARIDGRSVHQTVLPREVVGFGGWRPYQTLKHPLSTHKLLFREAMLKLGQPMPRTADLPRPDAPVPFDYLLKGDVGSFGTKILGPFRAGSMPKTDTVPAAAKEGEAYVEEFIDGRSLKVWFWGRRGFFAHAQAPAVVNGDGVRTLDELLRERLQRCAMDWDSYTDRYVILACLAFQGLAPDTVLAADASAWIDFRYAQRYESAAGATPVSDNALPELLETTGDQVARMGEALGGLMRDAFPAPILVSVDGMLDRQGRLLWLEMNTNSIMPPEGYGVMFDDLFS